MAQKISLNKATKFCSKSYLPFINAFYVTNFSLIVAVNQNLSWRKNAFVIWNVWTNFENIKFAICHPPCFLHEKSSLWSDVYPWSKLYEKFA